MEIKPIVTKADHRAALKEIEALMSARSGTPDGDRLDVLVTLVGWRRGSLIGRKGFCDLA